MMYFNNVAEVERFVLNQVDKAKECGANLIILDDETQPYLFDVLFYLMDAKTLAPKGEFETFKSNLEKMGFKVTYQRRYYTFDLKTQKSVSYPATLYINIK